MSNLNLEIKNFSHRVRYDYFLIWGHGMQYRDEILNIINEVSDFEIIKIQEHVEEDISKLVDAIYSYDYAPIKHLVNKTKYLLDTQSKVTFIFIKNKNAQESYVGEGRFRHIECALVKQVKEDIRDKYNPREEGERTHQHVVHASDNQMQTDFILRFLGYSLGSTTFESSPNLTLDLPFHISKFGAYKLQLIDIEDVNCSILSTNDGKIMAKQISVFETPHYKALVGDRTEYEAYFKQFGGKLLTDNHSYENLENIKESIGGYPFGNKYIAVRNRKGQKVVVDGVHRLAALAATGETKFIGLLIE